MQKYVITIARGYGSGGKTIGQMLSKKLGIQYYDKDLIKIASEDSGLNEGLFGDRDEKVKRTIGFTSRDAVSAGTLFEHQSKAIQKLAKDESCIIIGRCADYILRDLKNVARIYIYADMDQCIHTVMERFGYSEKEAKNKILAIDKERSEYYKYHTGHNWTETSNYDLCLNSSVLGFDAIVQMIESYLEIRFGEE